MTERVRNLMVGMTVIVSLVLLGAMVLIFQEVPAFLQLGYRLYVHAPQAAGVSEGADVFLAGRRVGRVTEVAFTGGDARKGVTFTVVIKSDTKVPGNVRAYLQKGGLVGGGTAIALDIDERWAGLPDAATGEPLAFLPAGTTIEAAQREDLLGQISEAMTSFTKLADTVNALLGVDEGAPGGPAATASAPAAGLRQTLARLDEALAHFNAVVGDPQNQANVKGALAGLNTAVAAAGETMRAIRQTATVTSEAMGQIGQAATQARGAMTQVASFAESAQERFDRLVRQIIDNSDRLGQLLATVNRVAAKADEGDGALGKMLNDPALYNSLLDVTVQLRKAVVEMQSLAETWKREGVRLRTR